MIYSLFEQEIFNTCRVWPGCWKLYTYYYEVCIYDCESAQCNVHCALADKNHWCNLPEDKARIQFCIRADDVNSLITHIFIVRWDVQSLPPSLSSVNRVHAQHLAIAWNWCSENNNRFGKVWRKLEMYSCNGVDGPIEMCNVNIISEAYAHDTQYEYPPGGHSDDRLEVIVFPAQS